jgi:membrane dipeptidase
MVVSMRRRLWFATMAMALLGCAHREAHREAPSEVDAAPPSAAARGAARTAPASSGAASSGVAASGSGALPTSAPGAVASAAPSASSSVIAPAGPPGLFLPPVAADGHYQVVDLHVDTPWKVHFKNRPLSLPEGHATVPMLQRGHYLGIVYPIYIPDYIHDNDPRISDADAILGTIEKLVASHDHLVFGHGGRPSSDQISVYVAIEGAGAFAKDIDQIDRFVARGIRLVGPVHAHDNKLATSATGSKRYGLTKLGKQFCERVYRAGALVDASHMSDRAFADLVPIAKAHGAPIVATHSNARALANSRRNLTDEQLRAIAKSGGVAGLNFHHTFVRRRGARMRDLVKHVRHMVEVAGVDHVAIGSDFDGGTPVIKDASGMQALAQALLADGMTDADVRKVFAGNAVRMLAWQPKAD